MMQQLLLQFYTSQNAASAVSSALFLSPAAFLSAADCFFSAITSLHPAGRPSLPRFSSITRKPSYKGDISRIASS